MPTEVDTRRAITIPECVRRDDGHSDSFNPEDSSQAATFLSSSRDDHEARAWYKTLVWKEEMCKFLLGLFYRNEPVDSDALATALFTGRRIYELGKMCYDFLALRQSEPNLAEAVAHSTAEPRNMLCGAGARGFLVRVNRAGVHAAAKIGAAERGLSYKGNARDPSAAGAPPRAGNARPPTSAARPGDGGAPRPAPPAAVEGVPRCGGRV